MSKPRIPRRTFLRAGGVALSLPLLEAMLPAALYAKPTEVKKRMVAMNVGLGLHAPNIIPEKSGKKYNLPPYLKIIEEFRDDFTVISGTSHPEVGGGHLSSKSFLTAAAHPRSASFKNTISIDQMVAEKTGTETRFGFLSLSTFGRGLSWTRNGVSIPSQTSPSRIYQQLFLQGKPHEKKMQVKRLQDGQSILDVVLDKTKQMERRLGTLDKQKLKEYYTAVREAERRLIKTQEWESIPKPKVNVKQPKDITQKAAILAKTKLHFDMIHLALQTDSTRAITFGINGMNQVPVGIPGVSIDYHNCSHHGKDPVKLKQLAAIEGGVMHAYHDFLKKLKSSQEAGSNLLDNTIVLLGSNLGNANNHDTRNLPILLAGGGFKHGQHLAFDQKKNYPLPNLYVSMLQQMGLETDTFVSSTGTMKGLEAS